MELNTLNTTQPRSTGEMDESLKLLFSVEEAAKLLGLGRTFTWQLVRGGQLESVRMGRRVLIARPALDRMIDRHQVRQT